MTAFDCSHAPRGRCSAIFPLYPCPPRLPTPTPAGCAARLCLVSHLPRQSLVAAHLVSWTGFTCRHSEEGPSQPLGESRGGTEHCRLELYLSAPLTYACAVVSKRTMGKYAFGSDGACSFEACQLRARGYERDWVSSTSSCGSREGAREPGRTCTCGQEALAGGSRTRRRPGSSTARRGTERASRP